MQFKNILNGNWLSFCAGRMTAEAMIKDTFPAQLLVHNGTNPPYTCSHAPAAMHVLVLQLLLKLV